MKFTTRIAVALAAALFSVAPVHAQQVLRSQTVSFDNIAALEAVPFARFQNGAAVIISADGRAGTFIKTTSDISALVTADPQQCVAVASPQTTDGTAGGYVRQSWLEEEKIINVNWCGADGNDNAAAAAANVTAIQAAIDLAEADISSSGKGGVVLARGHFILNATLTIDGEGVTIDGLITSNIIDRSGHPDQASTLEFENTTGDGVRCYVSSCTIRNLRIGSSAARIAASASATANGIRFEAVDTDDAANRVNLPTLENVQVLQHPGSGVALIGDTVGARFSSVMATNNQRHGIVIDRGDETSRVNLTQGGTAIRPGIINIIHSRVSDNDGHGIKIGSTSSGVNTPYRVYILGMESFRNALSAGSREGAFDFWAHGENINVVHSAVSGRDAVPNENVNSGVYVAGRNISLQNNRYISTDVPITVGYFVGGVVTDAVNIDQAFIGGGTSRTNAIVIESGVGDVWVNLSYAIGFSNVTSTASNATGYVQFGAATVLKTNSIDLDTSAFNLDDPITFDGTQTGVFEKSTEDGGAAFYGGAIATNTAAKLSLYGGSHATVPAESFIDGARLRVRSQNAGTTYADFQALDTDINGELTVDSVRSAAAFTIADDAVKSFSFSGVSGASVYGLLALSTNSTTGKPMIVAFRAGDGSAYCTLIAPQPAPADFTCTTATSAPTGTTGTDSYTIVTVDSDSLNLYIENREGGTIGYTPLWMALSDGYAQ